MRLVLLKGQILVKATEWVLGDDHKGNLITLEKAESVVRLQTKCRGLESPSNEVTFKHLQITTTSSMKRIGLQDISVVTTSNLLIVDQLLMKM